MNDRELLEKAARAAGIEVHDWLPGRHGFAIADGPYRGARWNPLTDDGDAFRLAVRLRLDVAQFEFAVRVDKVGIDDYYLPHGDDPYAATRRAIVRAAAALNKEP